MPFTGDTHTLPVGSGATDGVLSVASQLNIPIDDINDSLTEVAGRITTGLAAKVDDSQISAFGLTLVDDADAATARTTLGAQASDATLTSLSGLSLAEGDMLYATAADTLARLPKGTAAQVLAMNAGATAPEWVPLRTFGNIVKSSEYGHDIQTALDAASASATLMGADALVTLEIDTDNCELVEGLIVPANVEVFGNGKTVLDASNLAITDLINYQSGIKDGNGRLVFDARPLPGQTFENHYTATFGFDPVAVGDNFIDFYADTGMVVGDIFILWAEADYSWISFTSGSARPEYRKSDRFMVAGVDGNRVYFFGQARDEFTYSNTPGSTVKVYKQATRRGRFGGFTVNLEDNAISTNYAAAITGLVRGTIQDITLAGIRTAGLDINQCFGTVAKRVISTAKMSETGSASYPAFFTNSTECRIEDLRAAGYWHAADFLSNDLGPGCVMNRACVFDGITGTGTDNSSIAAALHGFADRCGYKNAHVSHVELAGREPFFDNGSINTLPGTTVNNAVYLGEMFGGYARISKTKINSLRNGTVSDAALWLLTRQGTTSEVFLDLHDIDIDMPNETGPLVVGANATATAGISLDFRGRANVPAATIAGLMRVWSPTAADITYSYLRCDVKGLPSGIPFGTSVTSTYGQPKFAERPVFPRQSGVWTTGATAAATETSGVINFDHKWPAYITPRGAATAQTNGKGNKASTGILAITADYIRPRVGTGDGTNMTAAAIDVAWEAW